MESLTPQFRSLIYQDLVASIVEAVPGFDAAFDGVVDDNGGIDSDSESKFFQYLPTINLSLLEDEPIANSLYAWVVNERDPYLAQTYTAALTKATSLQREAGGWTLGCQIASLHVFAIGVTTMQLPWSIAETIWESMAKQCSDAGIDPSPMATAIMECGVNTALTTDGYPNPNMIIDFLRESAQEIAADSEYWQEYFVG